MARSKSTPQKYASYAKRYLYRRGVEPARLRPAAPKSDAPVSRGNAIAEPHLLHLAAADQAYRETPEPTIGEDYELVRHTPTLKIYRRAGTDVYLAASRGTATAGDVLTDITLAAGALQLTNRYRQDRALLQELAAASPSARFGFTGHSLGGAVARQLSIDLGDRSLGGTTFNSAFDATQLAPSRHGSMTNYYTRGDALGRIAPYGHEYRYLSTVHFDPLRAHRLKAFK
jgi:hypothetical protein